MAETRRVDVGGADLYVEVFGDPDAPAVVFGHSLLCDGRMFSEQVTDLARDFRVINVDMRGHGRSGVPRGRFDMPSLGRDYARVMRAAGVERAVVVGLSMGGMAAMQLALQRPERVAGLVLMNTSAVRDPLPKRAQYGALSATARLFGVREFHLARVMPLMFGETFRRGDPDVVALWAERIGAMDRRALLWAERAVSGRPGMLSDLGRIDVPALVVGGAEDAATPPTLARQIAAALPDATLQILPATGHLSTIERPAVTTKLVRQHCERVFG